MERWRTEKQPKDGFTPFSSNVVTYQAKALLPFGTYTVSQNTRDYRPGLRKRPGLALLSPYGGTTGSIDIRASYNDNVDAILYGNVHAWSNSTYASLAAAYAGGIMDNDQYDEFDPTILAPGVRATGNDTNYGYGRCGTDFNLNRLGHITTITSASLFVKLLGAASWTSSQTDFGLCAAPLVSTASLDGPTPMDWTTMETFGLIMSARIAIDGTYGAGDIIEIPLNAYGISQLVAALPANGGLGQIGIGFQEYDFDYLASVTAINTESSSVNIKFDRYFPFLRIVTSDDPPACTSIYQYNNMRTGEQETLAYFDNLDIMEANVDPPSARGDVRTSADYPYTDGMPTAGKGSAASYSKAPSYDSMWGKYVFRQDGINANFDWVHYNVAAVTADDKPPSWAVLDDVVIMANSVGYAKFYGGQTPQPIKASLVIIDPAGDDTGIFNDDWWRDPDDANGLGVLVDIPAAFTTSSEVFLFTPILTSEYYFKITSANSGTGVMKPYYWNGDDWVEVTANFYDGTVVGGSSLEQSGILTSATFLLNKPTLINGLSGYCLKIKSDNSSMDATFVARAKYDWSGLTNVWNGILVNAVESRFYDASVTATYTYSYSAINISSMTAVDALYFSTVDKFARLYVNVGATPNLAATPTIVWSYWDGAAWVTLTVADDETAGFKQSGFITFDRSKMLLSQKQNFQGSLFGNHWFRMKTSATTLGTPVLITLSYEPILDIADFGTTVICCGVWKERAAYTFDKFPSWINITQNGTLNVLNGDDYAVLQAGDGRRHAVVAMRKFHNEFMVWQEEKGIEGGCVTLFEGYSPLTFGKLLLSAKIGTLNNNTVVIIDGALEASRTDYAAATLAYFISNYGVFMSDSQTVVSISSAIQNYFDPDSSDCIRNGYQNRCWLAHDPTHQVLRLGLVSGSSATEPNVFPVYDLITKRWSFDSFPTKYNIRCMSETSGGSSSAVQVSVIAGTTQGQIFHASSTNLNDGGDTAIDTSVRIELNDSGHLMNLNEVSVRMKRQSAGNCLFTVYENGVLNTGYSKTINMTTSKATYPQVGASEENVVERLLVGSFQEDNISITFGNSVINQDLYLYDFWIDSESLQNR